jgi:hypothetical protein
MAVVFGLGAVQLLLGGYWALQAHKPGTAIFGFVLGLLVLWFVTILIRRAQAFAAEGKAAKKSAVKDQS